VDIYQIMDGNHNTKKDPMGYTKTDTVSCRLLPEQIAELRALATTEQMSLCRFVGGLCLAALHDRKTQVQSPDTPRALTVCEDTLGEKVVATMDTE